MFAAPPYVANHRARRRAATNAVIPPFWSVCAVLCIASWGITGCHASNHPKPSGARVERMEVGVGPSPQPPRTAEAICGEVEAAWEVLDEALREVERNADDPARASQNLAAFVREHAVQARARARRLARALAEAPAGVRERARACTRQAIRRARLGAYAGTLTHVTTVQPDILDELLELLPPGPGEEPGASW